MKLWLAASLTLTLLAELAAARGCSHNYNYCGLTLVKLGTPPKERTHTFPGCVR
jgi:hypothetical protein